MENKYGFKVHSAYIGEVKRSLGLTNYEAANKVGELKHSHIPAPGIIAAEFGNCVINTIQRLNNAETYRPFHAALLSVKQDE